MLCCFFFSKNFAFDTENGESRLKFRNILETGNGESLKFQGNFDYSLRASQPVYTIYPVYCVLRRYSKSEQKKSAVLEVLAIEAGRFSAIDIRCSWVSIISLTSYFALLRSW